MHSIMACCKLAAFVKPILPRLTTVPCVSTCIRVPQRNRLHTSGFCYAAVLSREDKNGLLVGVQKENVAVVSHILELAKTAVDRWEVAHSDFLTPPVLEDALSAVKRLSEVGVAVSGGYAQAERCRLTVGHIRATEEGIDVHSEGGFHGAVAVLSISGKFMFDPAAHADFLGAILGTGITRDKVGDIIVQGETGAQAIVVPELLDFLITSLTQVRSISVNCESVPLSALQVQPAKQEDLKSVEASLRVDALASAGFRISRSKLTQLISGGDIKVNWKEITKGSTVLKSGDIVSIRGKGRLEIGDITMTKKGRYAVDLKRFV